MKRYVRDLEDALIGTLAAFDLDAERYDGLTGVWMPPSNGQGPRKVASIGVHVTRWVTTHGYALNVDLDPAPFTEWITACGLEDAAFTTMARELGRPVTVADVRPAAVAAIVGSPRPRGRGASDRRRYRALAGAATDATLGRAMTVENRPIPRPGWDPLPYDGCVGVVGRAPVREDDVLAAELRLSENATIHEHQANATRSSSASMARARPPSQVRPHRSAKASRHDGRKASRTVPGPKGRRWRRSWSSNSTDQPCDQLRWITLQGSRRGTRWAVLGKRAYAMLPHGTSLLDPGAAL